MSIYIDDDGDEVIFVRINGEVLAEISHETYGWAGMPEVIKIVEDLAEAFGIEVYNNQDIV